jgi:hypothetical protein
MPFTVSPRFFDIFLILAFHRGIAFAGDLFPPGLPTKTPCHSTRTIMSDQTNGSNPQRSWLLNGDKRMGLVYRQAMRLYGVYSFDMMTCGNSWRIKQPARRCSCPGFFCSSFRQNWLDLFRREFNCVSYTRWRSCLRHCATNRKVAGSIPDGVIGIFHRHNPSGRTMALGLAHPITEMSNRNNSWGVKVAGA